MLVAWTWSQLAHEFGIFNAAMIVLGYAAYIALRLPTMLDKRQRELREMGVSTGLSDAARLNRRRFTLRDMLVFATLIAAFGGLIVGLSQKGDKGIPIQDELRSLP